MKNRLISIAIVAVMVLFVGTRWLQGKKDEKTISIGTTLDLNLSGEKIIEAMSLAIKEINAKGGIKGKKLKLVALDDDYVPDKAKKNVEELLDKYNTNIVVSPRGSPTTARYLDLIKEGKVFVLAPFGGSPAIRKGYDHIVHMMPDYNEMELALFQLAKKDGKKFAFFAQDDEVTEGVRSIIAKADIEPKNHLFTTYERNTTDFSKQRKQIEEYKPQVIVLLTNVPAATAFLRQLGTENLVGKKLYSIQLGETTFKQFLRAQGIEKLLVDMQSVPNPEKSDLPLAREYRKALGSRKPDPYGLWAYWAMKVFEAIANKVEGDISPRSLAEAAKKIDIDLGGIKMKYKPGGPNLVSHVFIDDGQGGDWQMIELNQITGTKGNLEASLR